MKYPYRLFLKTLFYSEFEARAKRAIRLEARKQQGYKKCMRWKKRGLSEGKESFLLEMRGYYRCEDRLERGLLY